MTRFLIFAALLSGCMNNMTGQWAGTCAYADGSFSANMEVYADVFNDNGYTLEGSMVILDWEGISRSGTLSGTRSGSAVQMDGQFLSDIGSYTMSIDAERFSQSLEGDCGFRIPDGTGAMLGELTLTR